MYLLFLRLHIYSEIPIKLSNKRFTYFVYNFNVQQWRFIRTYYYSEFLREFKWEVILCYSTILRCTTVTIRTKIKYDRGGIY